MKKTMGLVLGVLIFWAGLVDLAYPLGQRKDSFSLKNLDGLERITLSVHSRDLLERHGFAVSPGDEKEIYDVYIQAKKKNQSIFVTTDAVLHTCHIFFDYLLRILEMEKLYAHVIELTDRMIAVSGGQYEEAKQEDVKEAARLNIGFFSVAKKILSPEFEPGFGLAKLIETELLNLDAHKGLEFRALLSYIENPTVFDTPYAYEDFSQYVPRGHYTRNEIFKKYFKVMMWYGRVDFKLKPGESEKASHHGKMMTLQALLIADALMKDEQAYRTWQMIFEPTAYFVGKTDDLSVDDYVKLIPDVFSEEGSVDRFGEEGRLSDFIARALKLQPPRILSGAAFVEDGEFVSTTKGFRFMGQRFIPDSQVFQELTYRRKGDKVILRYTGQGRPFTMEVIPAGGPVRAFPRGLDVMAVLGSQRALAILEQEGDTEYSYYYDQLNSLKQEFSTASPDEWKQNLYLRWLFCLLPLLEERSEDSMPNFMKSEIWMDKELQTSLGSWAELRHDTILYAKQSYPMMTTALPPQPELTYGYVEPYPDVYRRIQEMMADMRNNLGELGILIPGVPEKIREFEDILDRLTAISDKELAGKELDKQDYELIRNIGSVLSSLKRFPPQIMTKITSGTDERMDIIADVHTDLNTKQVLEEGVGSPFDIYVIIEDAKGYRLCRGGVFSYYEFKHPMGDRLTDEKWQEMGKQRQRPKQPPWTQAFISRF
ncbi:MAG: DUF3160 domain-containing protein [Candidatus Aminicenantes bacterium]|nr:MAG: DUF3160 domain-containing protein [Candidatus Aminicenantes bacterium]